MALEDLNPWFENLRNPSENADSVVDPETIINNISQVYTNDIAIRDAAVTEATRERDALKEREQQLMAENYKLLMKQPAGNVGGDGGNNGGGGDPEAERAATVTFADILHKK